MFILWFYPRLTQSKRNYNWAGFYIFENKSLQFCDYAKVNKRIKIEGNKCFSIIKYIIIEFNKFYFNKDKDKDKDYF